MTAIASASKDSYQPRVSRTKEGHRLDIDGLRAVAVIAVIVNHIDHRLLPSGHLGVDLFFVISGYVITMSLTTYETRSLGQFLALFYEKRIKRIIPTLLLVLISCSLATCMVSPTPITSLYTGIFAAFGAANIFLFYQSADYFAPASQYNTFTHTWSLGVEEQFYLVFPLIAYIFLFQRKLRNGRTELLVAIATLSAVSFLHQINTVETDNAAAFFSSFGEGFGNSDLESSYS